jgi:signal transduction histidine kinase
MMQEKQLGEKIEDYGNAIERSLQRILGMRNLIMDLLDFTKIRLERKEEKIEEVHLSNIASNSIITVRPYAIQMEVTVKLNIKSDSVIMADPTDMEIIFNNLVSNSVKYNRPGGKAEITIDGNDDDVIIVFSDTGIGIKEEDRKNLFAEFVRIKNEKTRNISGSGLGLSIVKKVIELYNGTISVESTPDVGSTFTVKLPKQQTKNP